MKAVVYGVGGMGVAVAYGMCKFGFDVTIIDTNQTNLLQAELFLLKNFGYKVNSCLTTEKPYACNIHIPKDTDILISCAPYNATETIAKSCHYHVNIRYCDLGGNTEISNRINSMAKKKPVFTDLGLAPGWANIVAEEMVEEGTKDVTIMCGGLPQKPQGGLQYSLVFNPYGLTNEYSGETTILENGECKQVKALSGCQDFGMVNHWRCEAFYTTGGLSHTFKLMQNRGVKNLCYKTIRYKGHLNIMKFLMEESGLSIENIHDVVQSACGWTKEDLVIFNVKVDNIERTTTILADEHFTAMQKGTSFPTAAVAAIMATGQLDDKPSLTYADVPLNEFNDRLKLLMGNYDVKENRY